jgi:N-acyl amino acid synthase of PEP-CTERM/exosortase system
LTFALSLPDRTNAAPAIRPPSIFEVYRSTFEALPADTPELLEAAQRLRYRVYCVENPFLPIADNPGERERDAYDSHSIQAVLIHRATGSIAGTIRLVLPRPGCVEGSLPIHAVCDHPLLRRPEVMAKTAEISRFAISKEFRRRAGDGLYGKFLDPQQAHDEWRRIIPHLSLGLMSAALQLGTQLGMDHACAVMEPSLLRLLSRFGLHFAPLGPVVDYHGQRQPCHTSVADLIARLERERHDVWEVITDRGRFWKPALRPGSCEGIG